MKNIRINRRVDQLRFGKPVEENLETDLKLQSRQRRADTKMDTATKNRMRLSLSIRLKNVGLIMDRGVSVRRT